MTGSRPAPRVAVIVLGYNSREVIRDCIESVARSTHGDTQIILVDNASSDGTPDWVERNCPTVTVLRNAENRGWSGGNNIGIRHALAGGADYIWLLNDDVRVEPDCISELISFAETQRCDLVSPLIYRSDDPHDMWFAGGFVDRAKGDVGHTPGLDVFRSLAQDERYISGCAMMVHRRVFERIGLIDERFFMYCEDADFSLRAARAGFCMDVAERARMYHKVDASRPGVDERNPIKAYNVLRSELLFWRKYLGWWAFHRRYCHGHLAKWINGLDVEWETEAGRAYAQAVLDAVWYVMFARREPRSHPVCPGWFRDRALRRPWLLAQLMAFRLP